MNNKTIKIIIADDHQLFTEGLLAILKKNHFLEVVADVKNGKELINYLQQHTTPDIVLLDIAMPEMNGFQVLKYLQQNYPSIKCLVLSMHNDGNYIAKCAELGAWGYLLKNTDTEALIYAIDQIYKGEKYYDAHSAQKMVESMSEIKKIKKLTKKEIEVFQLISKGFSTKEIADQLFISTRTVETHRANILKKVDAKNSIEMFQKSNLINLLDNQM